MSCSTVKTLWPSSGPEKRIREIPGRYGAADAFYEEGEFSGKDDQGHALEQVRWRLYAQKEHQFRLDLTAPGSELNARAVFRLVSDGQQMGVQNPGDEKLAVQPLPTPLRYYHLSGLMEGYAATPYLSQSLVFAWVVGENESQADLLLDLQQGVEVGTFWGEECVVYSYGDEAVKRLWRGKDRAEGGLLRVWVAKDEWRVVREEWQVRIEPESKAGRKAEIVLTFHHRAVRTGAELEAGTFALQALPVASGAEVAAALGKAAGPAAEASGSGAGPTGSGGAGGTATPAGSVLPPVDEGPALPEGARGVALRTLIEMLRNPNPEWATGAAVALHHEGRPEGLRRLQEWVRSRQPRWAGWAARAAAEVKDSSLKDALQEQTRMADPVPRVWVYRALYALGDARQIEALEEALRQPNVDVQIEATQAIAELRSRSVLDFLLANLAHADPDLRVWSAHAIGELADGRAREALEIALAGDSDTGVRLEAALGLRKIGDPNSRDALSKAVVNDSYKPVRLQAAAGLARLGDRKFFDFILAALKSSSGDARREAILVLGALGDPAGVAALVQFMEGDPAPADAETEEAAIALGRLAGPESVAALQRLLAHEAPRVRMRAALALVKTGDAAAIDVLSALARSEDPQIAYESARGLVGAVR